MQDSHSIGGGRLFGGGGDRRLRPHHHQNHQDLKCPRCDSSNTKFCYYNNYNLSQPRHFCKNCRRYWTKGGVLRNVPVGGGCRKIKRNSKSKPSSESSVQMHTPAQRERNPNSHSSSESSSTLTVTNSTNLEAVSVHSSSSVSNALSAMNERTKFLGHASSNNSNNNNSDPAFEHATTALLEQGSSDCGIFSEIGSFTSLITSSGEPLSFGYSNLLTAQQSLDNFQQSNGQAHWQQQQEQYKMATVSSMGADEVKMQEMTSGLLDQTVQVELSALQDRSGNGGFGSLDWHESGDQGLFDLPDTVDHASYWSQSTQWTDQDHTSVYLP